ncbi:MAG TPA: ABC transporter permease [bacterium]|nr:ABC transporter permease [bacterium]HPN45874.1 ABC transporter permease [bacterium]
MFVNYIKIAFRNIMRDKSHSIINILGLSLSLAVILLLFFYVRTEVTADRFHKNYRDIYRFQETDRANLSPQFYQIMQENCPELELVTRIASGYRRVVLDYNQPLYVSDVFFTDTTFFNIFTCEVIAGDLATALTEPASLVLTDREAGRLFGAENPVGKVVKLNNEHLLTVTAVIKKLPANSSLKFSAVIPVQFLKQVEGEDWEQINSTNFAHYFLCRQNVNMVDLADKIKLSFNSRNPGYFHNSSYSVLPFSEIYFNRTVHDSCYHGNSTQLALVITIGFLILVIAIINYINLAIAQSVRRMPEIGVRKVTGASRLSLINQFLIEAVIITLVSIGFGFLFAQFLSPYFNTLFNTVVFTGAINWPLLVIILLAAGIGLGCIAGLYPALYLTMQNPVQIIKGERVLGGRKSKLKTGLLIFQFVVSIVLIVCTLGMVQQRSFMQNHDLGFSAEKILLLNYSDNISTGFRQSLLQIPNLEQVAVTHNMPGTGHSSSNMSWTYKGVEKEIYFMHYNVDADFMPLLKFQLKEGRFFSKERDQNNPVCILNETAIREFGIDDVNLAQFTTFSDRGLSRPAEVVGIVKDFNQESLHSKITPFVFFFEPEPVSGIIVVKIITDDFKTLKDTIARLESVWKIYNPDIPFDIQFMNKMLANQYQNELRTEKIFIAFSLLAIIIACLGLLGLVSLIVEQRTKEIGIRKVVGASLTEIVMLMIKDFTWWLIIANLIAWPIAWYAMNQWLQNFTYRIHPSVWIFLLAGLAAFLVSLLTVSGQAIRAARTNPIEALRYE